MERGRTKMSVVERYEKVMDTVDEMKEKRIRSQESEKSLKIQMKTKIKQVKEVTGAGSVKELNKFIQDTEQKMIEDIEEAEEILSPYEDSTSEDESDFDDDDDDF
jgi:hypothetical protein